MKTAIIGGGAAGLCTAIMLKNLCPDVAVTVFEAGDRVGKKLAVTGNGRCNVSNEFLDASCFHGDSELAIRIIEQFPFDKQREFFETLGIPFKIEEKGKAYPRSLQASSVVDALRFKCEADGVKIRLSSRVNSIAKATDGVAVTVNGRTESFNAVVVATGGIAGGNLGTEDGYKLLKSVGHKIEMLFPSIVQLKTETQTVRQLKGIKVDAAVTLCSSLGARTETDEVLFCDYGLSGPAVMQVSRLAQGENPIISLDLLPEIAENDLKNIICNRTNLLKNRLCMEFFTGFLNKRLGQVILKECGVGLNEPSSVITEAVASKIANKLKNFKFKVLGNGGFENAQVTAGGAQTSQFFDSLMSKKVKGLFAVGEVLNVDGDCGGYNLAFAWSSAKVCADGIAEYLRGIVG